MHHPKLVDRISPLRALVALSLWAAVLLILLSGCSLIGQPLAEKAADVVRKYCAEPAGVRQAVREQVNKEAAPNSVHVTCAADPPPAPAPTTGVSDDAKDPRLYRARAAGEGESAAELKRWGADPRAGTDGGGDAGARRAAAPDGVPADRDVGL